MFRSLWVLPLLASTACASAGAGRAPFVGGVTGISTLSADARAIITATSAEASLYKPENGPAVNLFGGVHLTDYLSVQGNYIWNRNTLRLSSIRTPADTEFFEEQRRSRQHALIGDVLLYFRDRESWARPYLSAGAGVVRFSGGDATLLSARGAPPRPASFNATHPALRVAVGIDLSSKAGWVFRYSFSETISRNPVSPRLSPPGQRNLANFQNLFGVVRTF